MERSFPASGRPGPTYPLVRARGSHFEIGRQHGEQERDNITAFLADGLARLQRLLGARFDGAALRAESARYRRVIEAHLPGLAREVAGLAVGAGIDQDDAWLLQLRRELVGYQKIPPLGDCSTVATLDGRASMLAQTIDLNGGMRAELSVLDLTPDGARRSLMVSFTGLLGYLGMNESGLAVGLNLVLSGEWRPGIPAYLLIRHLLDSADTVDECIAIIESLPRASSRALTICDGAQLACIEYTPTQMLVRRGPRLAHTNHFLDTRLIGRDEINPFAHNSSLARLERCAAFLDRSSMPAEAQDYFDLLADAPMYIADNGDVRRECTVATAVLQPGLGRMAVRQGGTERTDVFEFLHL